MQSTEEDININDAYFNEISNKRVIKIFISEVNDHIYIYIHHFKASHQPINLMKANIMKSNQII